MDAPAKQVATGRQVEVENTKFQIPDPFGNQITLYANTWDVHILQDHKEMAKLLRTVENTVRNPTYIYQSSISDANLIFHGHNLLNPDPRILRAVVKYPTMQGLADLFSGGLQALVTTAFVLRPENEFTGNIGPQIYKRESKSKKKK
jgi:hypothetical protein